FCASFGASALAGGGTASFFTASCAMSRSAGARLRARTRLNEPASVTQRRNTIDSPFVLGHPVRFRAHDTAPSGYLWCRRITLGPQVWGTSRFRRVYPWQGWCARDIVFAQPNCLAASDELSAQVSRASAPRSSRI